MTRGRDNVAQSAVSDGEMVPRHCGQLGHLSLRRTPLDLSLQPALARRAAKEPRRGTINYVISYLSSEIPISYSCVNFSLETFCFCTASVPLSFCCPQIRTGRENGEVRGQRERGKKNGIIDSLPPGFPCTFESSARPTCLGGWLGRLSRFLACLGDAMHMQRDCLG